MSLDPERKAKMADWSDKDWWIANILCKQNAEGLIVPWELMLFAGAD